MRTKRFCCAWLLLCLWMGLAASSVGAAYPFHFLDGAGREITVTEAPRRIVSLVPAVTEMLVALGAIDRIQGVTYYDDHPASLAQKTIVGGFLAPNIDRIRGCAPDMIFVSGLQREVSEMFRGPTPAVVRFSPQSVADVYANILLLGRILDAEPAARELVERIRSQIDLIGRKVAKIPDEQHLRVMRIMGRKHLQTPTEDSIQNALIRLAGGIPPRFGDSRPLADVSREQWLQFNPQVIFGCGRDRTVVDKILSQPGWKEVEAISNGRVYYLPCELVRRTSVRLGQFVMRLASLIYAKQFADPRNRVLEEGLRSSTEVKMELPYVGKAHLDHVIIDDFLHKVLVIDLTEPMDVLSTLDGFRSGIVTLGNHGTPPPSWAITYYRGYAASRHHFFEVIQRDEKTSCFLITGANMDHLAVRRVAYRKLAVTALVTAGVQGNALRMAADQGFFYEPGTINIILLPNCRFTQRAMARAVVTATEAKTAALEDLDIRSSQQPLLYQATGTGTDNIIVAAGKGIVIDQTGGHTRMGELIANAVYDAVQEAIGKQNCLVEGRNIFQRLRERHIGLFEVMEWADLGNARQRCLRRLEGLLLRKDYAAFVASALALSDAYERGQVRDLVPFARWCAAMAQQVAGQPVGKLRPLLTNGRLPLVVRMALNALLNGIVNQSEATQQIRPVEVEPVKPSLPPVEADQSAPPASTR